MGDGQFLYHWKPQYFSVANSMLPCLVQNIISDSTVSKLTTAKNSGSKPRPIKISILGGHIEVSKSYINLRGRALLQRHRPQSLEGAHCLTIPECGYVTLKNVSFVPFFYTWTTRSHGDLRPDKSLQTRNTTTK